VPERPQLVADEVDRRDEHDRERLRHDLAEAGLDESVQDEEVRAERDGRDDEEAEPLEDDVAALAAERPEAVPDVVVGDGDEERSDRGRHVVEARSLEQQRVHDQVDDVARRADDAELDELLPVATVPERRVHAAARHLAWRRHRSLVHVAGRA
jgi:hypothetical protein